MVLLIGIVLLTTLSSSCACNCACSSDNGVGGDWNPSGTTIDFDNSEVREAGATLTIGEVVTVTAVIDIPNEVDEIIIELRDHDSSWKKQWITSDITWSQPFTFSESIIIPISAPIGDNYRLNLEITDDVDDFVSWGYSMLVEIITP